MDTSITRRRPECREARDRPDPLKRQRGGYVSNYFDVKTGEEYWISGVKRDGQDRHWTGSGPVEIDEDVREEYEALIARR